MNMRFLQRVCRQRHQHMRLRQHRHCLFSSVADDASSDGKQETVSATNDAPAPVKESPTARPPPLCLLPQVRKRLSKPQRFRAKTLVKGYPSAIVITKDTFGQFPQPVKYFVNGGQQQFGFGHDRSTNGIAYSLKKCHPYFESLCHSPTAYAPMSIFGQWSGPTFVPSAYALSGVECDRFFVSSLYLHATEEIVLCPYQIELMLQSPLGIQQDGLSILSYMDDVQVTLDPNQKHAIDPEQLLPKGDIDPYFKKEFNLSGRGEGAAFYPDDEVLPIERVRELSFQVLRDPICGTEVLSELIHRIGGEKSRRVQLAVQEMLTLDVLELAVATVANGVPVKTQTEAVYMYVIKCLTERMTEFSKSMGLGYEGLRHVIVKSVAAWYLEQCDISENPSST